jgi:hypothetical protein
MTLIYILIGVFIVLFAYQIFLALFPDKVVEGLENVSTTITNADTPSPDQYKPYNLSDPNNSLILPQQNAGNIEVLRGRLDKFDGINQKIDVIQRNVDAMQVQMDGLVQQQAQYAQELAGDTPPTITGTEELTSEDVEE